MTEADVYAMVLGRTIAELRERHGLSQVVLARQVELTQPTLSRIERGGTQPDPFTLRRIALAFKMAPPDLFQQIEAGYELAKVKARDNAPKNPKTEAAQPEESWLPAAALGALGVASIVGLAVAAVMASQPIQPRPRPTKHTEGGP